jgi:hypothetical protein
VVVQTTAAAVADCLPPELRLAVYGKVIAGIHVRYNTRYSFASLGGHWLMVAKPLR